MIQDLFDTGKDIFDQSARLCTKGEHERLKLANLLELIGHLMKDAAEKLKHGQLPASKSQQLELLSEELYFRLAFSVGEIKARALALKLKNGYVAEHLHGELDQSEYARQHLVVLDAAAEYFLATSRMLRGA